VREISGSSTRIAEVESRPIVIAPGGTPATPRAGMTFLTIPVTLASASALS
jgi:hypothetical protein